MGDVAGDDRFGIEAQASERHLHLLAGGVLSFIEDDEGIVKGAAAHEGEGRDFDGAFLEEAIELVGLKHVVERVVERAHIGIDFFLKEPGRKPRRSPASTAGRVENDAVDLLVAGH